MKDEPSGGTNLPVRDVPNIPADRLRACLRNAYGLDAATLEYLPRGRDYDAGVFRVQSAGGAAYLLKATTRPLYTPSYLVPRYLDEQGIASVVAPLPTTRPRAVGDAGRVAVTVYPFHRGDTSWTGMTGAHWRETGSIFRRIHELPLRRIDSAGLGPLRRETFDPAGYINWVRDLRREHLPARTDGRRGDAARALRAAWVAHQPEIHAIVIALEALARGARVARPASCDLPRRSPCGEPVA